MRERLWSRRLAAQFGTLLGGRFAAAIIQAASIYLLARWADIATFGILASALGVAITLQAIGDAGATTYIVRETALRGLTHKVASAELLSRFTITTVALAGVIASIAMSSYASMAYLALIPIAGWMIADSVCDIKAAMARGLGDVKVGTRNIVYRRVIQLSLFILLYFCGTPTSWAYSMSLLLGSTFVLVVMWREFPKPPALSLRFRMMMAAFLRCRPYWVHSAATQLRNVDTAIVAAVAGVNQAAYYGISARLMTPLRMLPATLATALLPHLVKGKKSRREDLLLASGIAALISLPYIPLVAIAPWITQFLGPSFHDATVPLQLMSAGLIAASFISIFNAILHARGRARMVASISTLTALLLLVMVFLGAILHGADGAAMAFMVATLAHAAVLFYKVKTDEENELGSS